jgi:hypothetical protein
VRSGETFEKKRKSINLPGKRLLLVDERHPAAALEINVPRDAFHNSQQSIKKSFWHKIKEVLTLGLLTNQQQISLRVVEGASLTLMGVIRFDLNSMQWRMTELCEVMFGSASECADIMAEHVKDLKLSAFLGSFCSSILLAIAITKI